MRTRLIVSACLALVASLVWLTISSCATHPSGNPADTKHNVVFESGGLAILLPGTEVSDSDAEAVNRILSKYDKEIYRLKTYRNGQPTKSRGSLKKFVLDQTLVSAMAANVKKAGFTQFAVQLGIGNNPHTSQQATPAPSPGASTNPQVMPSASPVGSGVTQAQKAQQASMDLVTELKPILEKYR
jgi:hypothetical protein